MIIYSTTIILYAKLLDNILEIIKISFEFIKTSIDILIIKGLLSKYFGYRISGISGKKFRVSYNS